MSTGPSSAPVGGLSFSDSCTVGVPALSADRVAFLASKGVEVTPLEPLGAAVRGLDLRKQPREDVLDTLQREMAERGFVVFKDQGVLSGEEQVRASEYWGGREMHSTHGVHPRAPNRHIFRLSNDPDVGILGVGPQWHNDGSFERGVFSHVGYHIINVPENGGGTLYAHQGAAFDMLPDDVAERWKRYVSVNSNSGVLHPMVHAHPISGRLSVYLHLGMTGAVIEVNDVPDKPDEKSLRLLEDEEMRQLFNQYNDLLNAGLSDDSPYRTAPERQQRPEGVKPFTTAYQYEKGDVVFIDNLAVAHRAAPEAHESHLKQGLRVLHRTTIKAMKNFDPPYGLPPMVNVHGPNPLGQGVWRGGGVGYRWDDGIRMQNDARGSTLELVPLLFGVVVLARCLQVLAAGWCGCRMITGPPRGARAAGIVLSEDAGSAIRVD
eukprot:CAMPEP_0185176054 /NCGR_PEP_ID=MMETSP1139-20130426/27737_1 /TAXON_ID=298111 /ORGANISM="Pavlova sp., Strain CCMP459" /LENGTH=433 /DNA_ID=CAMNT_0027741803 /DNA_START=9 /DNA_END=1311 /DNA_ORIENTATION=+